MQNTTQKIQLQQYKGVDDTLANIKALIKRHYNEPYMQRFKGMPLSEIYNTVQNIPYVLDPQNDILTGDDIELLQSPYFTIYKGGDCDDKSILLGAIFELNKIPYRMAVTSSTPDQQLHHIYPEILISDNAGGKIWVPFDATYSSWDLNHTPSQPFYENDFTKKRIYDWRNGETVTFETNANTPESHAADNYTPDALKKKFQRVQTMQGMNNNQNLNGVKLGILQGAKKSVLSMPYRNQLVYGCKSCGANCPCKGDCNKLSTQLLGYISTIDPFVARNLKAIQLLGFDLTSIVSVVEGLFSSMFSKPAYVDAYHAYYQAVSQLPQLQAMHTVQGAQLLASQEAIIAVLLVDFMNPPGANVCTPPGDSYYCGNRAKWADIQPLVQTRATTLAPFLYYVAMQRAANNVQNVQGFSEADLRSLYAEFKAGAGTNYNAYHASTGGTNLAPGNTGLTTAGMSSNTLLFVGLAAAAVYMISQKKKTKS